MPYYEQDQEIDQNVAANKLEGAILHVGCIFISPFVTLYACTIRKFPLNFLAHNY